jgi:hypothetical protein
MGMSMMSRGPALLLVAACLLAPPFATAHAQAPPVTVTVPKAINLGSTSFFDGYGRQDQGWSLLQYGRFEDLTRITDSNGNNNPLFKGTHINVLVSQTQIAYTFPFDPFGLGGHVGFNALQALTDFTATDFASNSPVKLTNNRAGIGDLNWGPFYQSKVYLQNGLPVFVWRAQFGVYSPTGSLNTAKNINQGNGYWAIDPYIAFTYQPIPQVEISSRINYQYNFETSTIQSPPPIPHLVYRNGQAGSMIYGNLAASYALFPNKFFLGVNSYFVEQLTNDITNGTSIANSREVEFSIGPGLRYVFDEANNLNLNLYFNVVSQNATTGTQFNFQYIHRF